MEFEHERFGVHSTLIGGGRQDGGEYFGVHLETEVENEAKNETVVQNKS